MTVNETWIRHYTFEAKQQSKQWAALGGQCAPKKAKTVLSAGKVTVTVFWDSQEIIYLQKGQTITGTYYSKYISESFVRRAANEMIEIGAQKGHLLPR